MTQAAKLSEILSKLQLGNLSEIFIYYEAVTVS